MNYVTNFLKSKNMPESRYNFMKLYKNTGSKISHLWVETRWFRYTYTGGIVKCYEVNWAWTTAPGVT